MKNKGFSLIELIVVVAIMAVALTVGGYALSAISLANGKNCANEINTGLERTRTHSYSSDHDSVKAQITFYRDTASGNLMMKKNFEGTAKKIGGASVKLEYRISGEADYTEVTDAAGITFSFNRSTGGFSSSYDSLKITSGGKTYTITCYLLTGKTKLE